MNLLQENSSIILPPKPDLGYGISSFVYFIIKLLQRRAKEFAKAFLRGDF
jgi:hypothetical protein